MPQKTGRKFVEYSITQQCWSVVHWCIMGPLKSLYG